MRASATRARLSLVLLLYFLGVILVLTLAPFRFSAPPFLLILIGGGAFDIAANVLLFVPLGFLYPLTRSDDGDPSVTRAFLLGLLLSASIETVQLFEPQRFTSVIDVLTNAAGAALGAALVRAVVRRVRVNASFVGRLSLEIPLIGLIYLLVPLLLVASLSAVERPARLIALVPLGLTGARLIAAVERNHFGPTGLLSRRGTALASAGWMILGTFPVLLRYPLRGAALVVLVAVMTWYASPRAPTDAEGRERRFELDALRGAAPYIAIYFVALILLPLAGRVGEWRFDIGLTGAGNDVDRQQLRLLEPVASLTVLGYLLAEARGRLEAAFGRIARRVGAECAVVAVAIETSRGFQSGEGASGIQFFLMVAAGLLGAGIYHHQRAHVRWILANRGSSGERSGSPISEADRAVSLR